jgi:hypothetical protein
MTPYVQFIMPSCIESSSFSFFGLTGGRCLFIDPVVSIEKCSDPHDEEAVERALRSSVDLLGGLNALIMPGDVVLIKPNLVDNFLP